MEPIPIARGIDGYVPELVSGFVEKAQREGSGNKNRLSLIFFLNACFGPTKSVV